MKLQLTPDMIIDPSIKKTNNISSLFKIVEDEFDSKMEILKADPTYNSFLQDFQNYKNLISSFYLMGLRDYETNLNTSQKMIQEKGKFSVCPNCEHSFEGYEHTLLDNIIRDYSLTRCPFCGQKIEWQG